jgi:phytoene synthase
MSPYSLRNSISACDRLTQSARSNFAPAFGLLPTAKRQAMKILYAYTRFTDDLADSPDINPETGETLPTSPRRKRQKVNQWSNIVEAVFGFPGESEAQIDSAENTAAFEQLEQKFPGCGGVVYLPALKMIVDQFGIPRESLFHLIEGVESDIEPRRFETFDDCADYCHQVATSVGFASLAIWETTEPLFSDPIVRAAKACGIAFQWTNILRDIVDDAKNDRFYLPQKELSRFGLTEKQFLEALEYKGQDDRKRRPKKMTSIEQYQYENAMRRNGDFERKLETFLLHQFER